MTSRIRSDALKLLAWLGCTIVLGAALAPALFNIGKALVGFRMFDGYIGKVLEESDFGRYFNRAMLLAAVICIFPLLRSLIAKKELAAGTPAEEGLARSLVGATGTAVTDLRPSGTIRVGGIQHDAISRQGLIPKGESVRVLEDGMTYVVEPVTKRS